MAILAAFVGNNKSQKMLVPRLEQTGIELHCFTSLVDALIYVSFEESRQIRYLIISKEMLTSVERLNQLRGALQTASSGWAIERPIDLSDSKLTTALINELKRAVTAEKEKTLKRVLFLGDRGLIAKMLALIPTDDDNLLVCYATQVKMARQMADKGVIELIVINLASVPQDEIDQLFGAPLPKDVDATADYQEPKLDLPAGVEFYSFNPLEADAPQKLLAKLRG